MAIFIPKQLQNDDFRFVLLGKHNEWGKIENNKISSTNFITKEMYSKCKEDKTLVPMGKAPFEYNWQNNGYKYNDKKLLNHISSSKNYGVIGGYGRLRIIDIDNKELGKKLEKEFNSFTITTGSGGKHIYILSDYEENHVFVDRKGELRAKNYQVVGPNSIHPNFNNYIISNDVEIKEINEKKLLKILKELLKEDIDYSASQQSSATKEYIITSILPRLSDRVRLLITQKKSEEELKKLNIKSRSERDQEVITQLYFKGFHRYIKTIFEQFPVGDKYKEHGSGDKYLSHNLKTAIKYSNIKDPSALFLENKINYMFEEMLKHNIDDLLKEISNINNWVTRHRLIRLLARKVDMNEKMTFRRFHELRRRKTFKRVVNNMKSIMKEEDEESSYYINKLLPNNRVVLLQAKPFAGKSFIALSMIMSILDKQSSFLNNFEINNKYNPRVLYYDLDAGTKIQKSRIKNLLKGNMLKDESCANNLTIWEDFNNSNVQEEVETCKNFDIIILDTYSKCLSGNENDSSAVNSFFIEFIDELKLEGKLIILIHHLKKGDTSNLSQEDYIYMGRGSSATSANVDIILTLESTVLINDRDAKMSEIKVLATKDKWEDGIRSFKFNLTKDRKNDCSKLKFTGFGYKTTQKDIIKKSIIELIRIKNILSLNDIYKYISNYHTITKMSVHNYLTELVKDDKLVKNTNSEYSLPNAKQTTFTP